MVALFAGSTGANSIPLTTASPNDMGSSDSSQQRGHIRGSATGTKVTKVPLQAFSPANCPPACQGSPLERRFVWLLDARVFLEHNHPIGCQSVQTSKRVALHNGSTRFLRWRSLDLDVPHCLWSLALFGGPGFLFLLHIITVLSLLTSFSPSHSNDLSSCVSLIHSLLKIL